MCSALDQCGWSAECDDVDRLRVHPSNKISFDPAEAGPGEISGTVGDHPLSFEMTSNNRLKLVPPQMRSSGNIVQRHTVSKRIETCARAGGLEPPVLDTRRVLLKGRGLTSVKEGR